MNLYQAAKRLGGEVVGPGILAPGPGHSRRDRSLRVFLDPDAPGGFRVTSFANDDWRDCRAHVEKFLGVEPWRPGQSKSPVGEINSDHVGRRKPANVPVYIHDADAGRKHDLALAIWTDAVPVNGTIAAGYLATRVGRTIDPWPDDLRFHDQCLRGEERLPALIALLRNIVTEEPQAIQRIFLKVGGGDRLRDQMGKATLGPAAGCVVKLSPNDAVTHGLGICEGIEKGLALLAIGWSPIWATCGSSGMAKFPILSSIETLTIFGDNDRAGQRAAEECAGRWSANNREVKVRTPKTDETDWGDALERTA